MAKRRPDLLIDPPREFKRLVERAGVEGSHVELIEPGDEIVIEKATETA
jgi:hypothetical protein